jgi:hypothetical protein
MLTSFSATRAWSATVLALLLGLSAAGRAQADSYDDAADPPNRVARLSYLGGQVSFQPSGDGNWVQASINRPLVTGDALYADRGSRAELEIGGAAVRLDDRTSMSVLNLDDRIAQFQLSEGTANLSVRNLGQGGSYEVDTPTLAFVVTMPGEYRIDIAPDGNSTMITVFDGGGDVYGENNASYSVRAGNSYRFNDSALRDYEILDLPRPDDFDNWVQSRQRQYSRSVSSRYVADDMIGVADLDSAGRWSTDAQYGEVWYPTSVAVDYVPYRDGHWSWIDPWGWTWVDNAAWGFAPFHYGRWVYVSNRWGWCPVRATCAPCTRRRWSPSSAASRSAWAARSAGSRSARATSTCRGTAPRAATSTRSTCATRRSSTTPTSPTSTTTIRAAARSTATTCGAATPRR